MKVADAAIKAGLPYRTAVRWVEDGLIRPKGYDRKTWRRRKQIPWGEKETAELCRLAALRDFLSLQELKKAAAFLRAHGHNPFSSGEFLLVEISPNRKRLVKIAESKDEALEILGKTEAQLMLLPVLVGEAEDE